MTRRLSASILILIVSVCALFFHALVPDAVAQESPACKLCSDTRALRCPTCTGEGKAKLGCDVCSGAGRAACPLPHYSKTRGGSATGLMICPSHECRAGNVRWGQYHNSSCKLCKRAGGMKCKSCKDKAKWRCAACKGKFKSERECDDCAGSGKLVCLACTDPESSLTCVTCEGARDLKCTRCDGKLMANQACEPCAGRGDHPCVQCGTLARMTCVECRGTGTVYFRYIGGGDGTEKCVTCSRKGSVRCGSCKKGASECGACSGSAESRSPCRLCARTGKLSCPTCGKTSYRSAEIQAERLAKLGQRDKAVALYERARRAAKSALGNAEQRRNAARKEAPGRTDKPQGGTRDQALDRHLKALFRNYRAFVVNLGAWRRADRDCDACEEAIERIDAALEKLKAE